MRAEWARRLGRATRALPPGEAYALWAASYPAHAHNPLMVAEQAAVEALLPPLDGRRVLDAGCGTGRYLRRLRQLGAALVVGVDRSAEMLTAGCDDGEPRLRGEITALPIAGASVDVVVSGLAFNDVANLDAALGECARVLTPGGALVYSVVHPRGAREGWRRDFDAGGVRVALAGWWHTPDEHLRACRSAGLEVRAVREPVVDGDAARGPVALVVAAERPA